MKPLLSILIAALGTLLAPAQIPAQPFIYSFTNLPIWDFSGQYQGTVQGDIVTIQLVHGATGKISGTKQEVEITDTANLYGSASINGRVFWTPLATGFSVSPYGETVTGTMNGISVLANATGHSKWTLEPSLLSFQIAAAARVCVLGHGCVNSDQGFQLPLPSNMDGTWSLGFTVTQTKNTLLGVGAVSLSNGRILGYNVRGTYNPKTTVSTLRISGYGETFGTSLIVKTMGQQMAMFSLTGSILGQRLRFLSALGPSSN